MNINLNDANLSQDEIEEHVDIMRRASPATNYTGRAMLLPEPEYLGAGVYRVWLEGKPQAGVDPSWYWVTPDGEILSSHRPWDVTG